MNPTTIPTPSASSTTVTTTSTVTTSSSTSSPVQAFHVLEISLISAQDLAQVSKSMRTYAVAWIHPNHKRTTRVDQHGHNNPTWNDRIAFHVDYELLYSDEAAVTVEIHTVSWFRDVLVGTVCVLMSDLITPYARNSTRFVALQIRRPSGIAQGKLNMGVALMDGTKRSMPISRANNASDTDYHDTLQKTLDKMNLQDKTVENDDDEQQVPIKIQLWRSYSVGTSDVSEEFPAKAGSVCNGSMVDGSMCNSSMVNGSELCSDVGPSASIVAAEIAQKSRYRPPIPDKSTNILHTKQENNFCNSIVEDLTIEEARAKGLTSNIARWKKEVSFKHEKDARKFEKSHESTSKHSRRHSDGGLFSCFGNAYGFEFTIVCGSSTCSNKPKDSKSQRRLTYSETNSA